MAKWTSGRSERTLNQSAANGRKEPTLLNAARCANDPFCDSKEIVLSASRQLSLDRFNI